MNENLNTLNTACDFVNQELTDNIVDKKDNDRYLTRSAITSPKPSTTTGIFPIICLICGAKNKKVNGQLQKLISASSDQIQDNISDAAKLLDDRKLLTRIINVSFSKEVKYHNVCRLQYIRNASKLETNKVKDQTNCSDWHIVRTSHNKSFDLLKEIIQNSAIDAKEVQFLNYLNNHYIAIFRENAGDGFSDTSHSVQKIEEKIKNAFGDSVAISKGRTRRGNIIYDASLSVEELLRKETLTSTKEDVKIKEVAFLIRKSILDCKHQPLQENITLEDIKKGEIETPEILENFLTYLIAGPDSRRHESDVKQRRIKSIIDDVIYAATGGKKKPSKHLMLGMAIKSLTGSRTVLQVLNRYGYCSSYNTIQEIETELTFEANKRQEILPYGIELGINDTGIAWDNYDCFVETKDGKDTLQDTVEISYQTLQKQVEPENNENNSIENEIDLEIQRFHDKKDLGNKKKRRRAYSSRMLDIEPYRKKPKMDASKLLPPSDKRYAFYPPSLAVSQKKDFLWVFSSKFDETNSIPMWIGWNSRNDASSFDQKQKIFYLPQIDQSPTSHSVVLETMRRSQQLAKESKIKEITVTYDLAIANVVM